MKRTSKQNEPDPLQVPADRGEKPGSDGKERRDQQAGPDPYLDAQTEKMPGPPRRKV